MTASNLIMPHANFSLASRGPSTHGTSRRPTAPGVRRRIDIQPDDVLELGGERRDRSSSLKVRMRCGCRPCAAQIRCTERTLMPAGRRHRAAGPVGRLAGRRRARSASTTGRPRPRPATAACRAGRVLSRSSPRHPSAMNRSCQRHTVGLATPACRVIAIVPTPSPLNRTIRAPGARARRDRSPRRRPPAGTPHPCAAQRTR